MAKTLAMSAILTFLPYLASAQCSHERAAMSCAENTVWDAEQESCVPVTG